ncbi:DUF2845 domain-containing protein [Solimonas terrae]|uniref:DUF2845 domain-containing protein n=1 Tax=Solimonas terrae TaxID=1396819 RepID=A0A6M2BVQ3_9GAMM|nr:DUF2845 domain-containing protein [Solimonas terrae]NGY06037.1 DUF2845 domain-containing protein [Solimonas terrae]
MKPLSILLALCVLLLLLPLPSRAADSMRCGSRIASVGMTAAELLAVCGDPSYRDVWAQPGGYGGGYLGNVEEWTYNFGSSQLLRVLRFRQGRLLSIDDDGYGFATDGPGDCSQSGIVRGMSKYRLLMQCGDPVTKVADVVQAPVDRYDRGYDLRRSYNSWEIVYREEWVYNFGRGRLMRIVHLDNARVTDVEFGDRG